MLDRALETLASSEGSDFGLEPDEAGSALCSASSSRRKNWRALFYLINFFPEPVECARKVAELLYPHNPQLQIGSSAGTPETLCGAR